MSDETKLPDEMKIKEAMDFVRANMVGGAGLALALASLELSVGDTDGAVDTICAAMGAAILKFNEEHETTDEVTAKLFQRKAE